MVDDSLSHRRKADSQFGVLMCSQVHVIDQEKPSRSERGDGLAKLEDLPARRIGEDQIERSDRPDEIGSVALDDRDPVRLADTPCRRGDRRIDLHADHLHVGPRSEAVDDPGEAHSASCADLQDPSPNGDCIGQAGHQLSHLWL